MLRLVVDARLAHCMCRTPPLSQLAVQGALAGLSASDESFSLVKERLGRVAQAEVDPPGYDELVGFSSDLTDGFYQSGAAFGNIDIVNGEVQQSNFHDYPVIRLPQMPKVEVHILPSDELPTGVGEQATTPIAPAVANALFNATGRRVRRFPLSSQGFNLV